MSQMTYKYGSFPVCETVYMTFKLEYNDKNDNNRLKLRETCRKGDSRVKAEYINPFLESARIVLEQLIQIRPTTGQLGIKDVKFVEKYIWIQIGMTGQMTGDIVFGLHEEVALKLVSAMMGGYHITEMDEMTKSAISELGNMISGNASTILFNQGVRVDITPPKLVQSINAAGFTPKKALTIPLIMDQIGELNIQVLIT
jgi:chemotaxis protein CheX